MSQHLPSPPKSRWQFSLRTMFFVMAAFCIYFALMRSMRVPAPVLAGLLPLFMAEVWAGWNILLNCDQFHSSDGLASLGSIVLSVIVGLVFLGTLVILPNQVSREWISDAGSYARGLFYIYTYGLCFVALACTIVALILAMPMAVLSQLFLWAKGNRHRAWLFGLLAGLIPGGLIAAAVYASRQDFENFIVPLLLAYVLPSATGLLAGWQSDRRQEQEESEHEAKRRRDKQELDKALEFFDDQNSP